MADLRFHAEGLEPDQSREWPKRDDAPKRVPRWAAWAGGLAAVVYVSHYPGTFEISAPQAGGATTARFVAVTGTLDNPLIQSVAFDVNGSYRAAPVENGRFRSIVPLVRGVNVIQASVSGTAALVAPGSNVLTINADIPPSDIWSELTWDGPADIDLHLYLPNGEHCFFSNRGTRAGAVLDVDNTLSDGPEHIVMDNALPGKYRMTVLYYAQHGPAREVPWRLRLMLRDGAETRDFSGVLSAVNQETELWTLDWPPG